MSDASLVGIQDTLKSSWEIYRGNIALFTKIILPAVVLSILGGFFASGGRAYSGLTILVSLANLFVSLAVNIALIYAAADRISGVDASFYSSMSKVKPKFLKFLVGTVLLAVVVGIGMVFLVFPGIYLGTALVLIPVVLVLEDGKIMESFGRSWELVNQSFWRVLFLLVIVLMAIIIPVGIITQTFKGPALAGILTSAASAFFTPMPFIILVKLYNKLKDAQNVSVAASGPVLK